jgi:hypothetical protein
LDSGSLGFQGWQLALGKKPSRCACDEDHPAGMPSLEEIYLELRKWTGPDEEWCLEQNTWKLHDIWLSNGFRVDGRRIRSWRAALRGWLRHKD